ncbi:hypothetical protein U8D42_13310 [Mycobacterium europaeum]|uniref:hypothetical protein n=1 Tax=Mycobacterium europaeum TaxID=761804 RepID=UPI002AE0B045|nr:hypothetical protein [Mycobacterium europaeum]MEA1160556.1 hypothetical protein [Mycobacterium europaeum]
MSQPTDDALAALNFTADMSGSGDPAPSDALDFSAPKDGKGSESVIEALGEFSPNEPVDTTTDLDAINSQSPASGEPQKDAVEVVTVTNPPGTVSVSVLLDGTMESVGLSPKVTGMTEAELADEILVIAALARQQGLAAQQSYWLDGSSLSEVMREVGSDGADAVQEFMEQGLGLTSPESAAVAQAEVFATRYHSKR